MRRELAPSAWNRNVRCRPGIVWGSRYPGSSHYPPRHYGRASAGSDDYPQHSASTHDRSTDHNITTNHNIAADHKHNGVLSSGDLRLYRSLR